MRRSNPLLLLFFFVVSALPEEPKQENKDSTSLRAYVLETQGRHALGMYVGKRKVGWTVIELKLGSHKGKEVAAETTEMRLLSEESRSTTIYDLEGDGPIVFFEEREVDNGRETLRKALRDKTEMVITTRSPVGETERRVPLSKDTLAVRRKLDQWLKGPPEDGAKFELHSASWDEDEVDRKEAFTYRGKRSMVWGGIRTDVYSVDEDMKGAVLRWEITSDGTPLKMKMALLDLRAEKESQAKDLKSGGKVDMLLASYIPVNKDLGDPAKVKSLTLEISGLESLNIPTSRRQRLASGKGEKVILKLTQDQRVDSPETLSKTDKERYLKSSPAISADQEGVRAKAKEILGGERDAFKASKLLENWVYKNLRKTTAANASTALDVIKTLAGDCSEHTLLFVALARASGIPAREVGGVAFSSSDQPLFAWHAWAEIHDGSQWVSIDPTWDQVFVDATHLKLSEESDDWSWLNAVGKLRIKVLNFKSKK